MLTIIMMSHLNAAALARPTILREYTNFSNFYTKSTTAVKTEQLLYIEPVCIAIGTEFALKMSPIPVSDGQWTLGGHGTWKTGY